MLNFHVIRYIAGIDGCKTAINFPINSPQDKKEYMVLPPQVPLLLDKKRHFLLEKKHVPVVLLTI
jgi:hypothetical protein